MYFKYLKDHVKEMRGMAEMLTPYSYPLKSKEDESDIACLKQRNAFIDGYDVGLLFSIASCNSHKLESLQVFGHYFSFLPFSLVIKIGRVFLGDEGLYLTEVQSSKSGLVDDGMRNIYVWTTHRDVDNRIIPSPFFRNPERINQNGFNFYKINESEISFF
jgi:hypothetical protein